MEEKTLKDEVRELREALTSGEIKVKKEKKFKIPTKGRVNNSNMKKGYATVVVIEDNRNIDFIKEPIIDGTIKLKDTFHAVDEADIFFYKNKPVIFQPKKKINPYNPLEGEHQTYGQKYVMARMEGDKITNKKGFGMGVAIIGGIIAIAILYSLFFGGG